MGVGPIARWNRAAVPELAARLKWALVVALVSALLLPFVLGRWSPLIAARSVSRAVAVREHRGQPVAAAQRFASRQSVGEARRESALYYGMLLAHFGVGVFIVGVTLVKG
jgi:cytochrome c-type biogenesis protein CcmF